MDNLYYKLAASFLAGILIGVGGTSLWFANEQDDTASNMPGAVNGAAESELETESKPASGAVSREDNWVVVEDQFPGNQVQLTAVSFSSSGWVAIYEDRDGVPGNILGAQRFDAGEHSGTVDLTRGTKEGQLYYAILHHDDGDRKFDHKIDLQLLDENGNRIEMRFQTPSHRN